MKRIISVVLVFLTALSLFACQPQEQTESKNETVEQANNLVKEGKIKEAYELLYGDKDNAQAKEMLEKFKVLPSRQDLKYYKTYKSETISTYNEHGDAVHVIYKPFNGLDDEKTFEYTYNEKGLCVKTYNGKKTVYYEYDENGNKIKETTDYEGKVHDITEHSYDGSNNLIQSKLLSINSETGETEVVVVDDYVYDENGILLEQRSDNMGNFVVTKYEYNEKGDVVKETEKRTYKDNDVESTTETLNEYDYDEKDRKIKIATNSYIKYTSSEYDHLLYNSIKSYEYNEKGDILKETVNYGDEEIICYEYEYSYFENGNIKTKKETYNVWTENFMVTSYDEKGNIISRETEDSKDSNEYTYDENGRVIKKIYTNAENQIFTYEYRYDEKGNLVLENKIDEHDNIVVTEYEYNENNVMIREFIDYGSGKTYETKFDDKGNKIYHKSTEYGGYKIEKFDYVYDSNGNMTEKTYTKEDKTFMSYKYTYNEKGNLLKTECLDSAGNIYSVHENEYDENGNLILMIRKDNDGEETYRHESSYDEYGNLISEFIKDFQLEDYVSKTEYSGFVYFYLG